MIASINRWLIFIVRVISGCAFLFMVGVSFVDAIGRQLHMPLLGSYEYVRLALITFFFASLALVVRDDGHIRVGLFADLYKPRLAKIERYFTGIVEAAALVLLSWMIFDQASRLERFGTVSTFFRIPMSPWVYAAGVMSLIAIWFAIINLGKLRPEQKPRAHALPEEEK
jgi:TRAP-type C4-dicarboxylate transport system permease small subunit